VFTGGKYKGRLRVWELSCPNTQRYLVMRRNPCRLALRVSGSWREARKTCWSRSPSDTAIVTCASPAGIGPPIVSTTAIEQRTKAIRPALNTLIDSVPGGGLAAFDCGNAEHRVTPFVGGEGCLGSWARHPTSVARIPTDSLVDGSVNLVTGC
jgi:hypothetical protein